MCKDHGRSKYMIRYNRSTQCFELITPMARSTLIAESLLPTCREISFQALCFIRVFVTIMINLPKKTEYHTHSAFFLFVYSTKSRSSSTRAKTSLDLVRQ